MGVCLAPQMPPPTSFQMSCRLFGRLVPQDGNEAGAIDAVLTAGVADVVKAGDRAADTAHLEIEKDADGDGPSAHDLVDEAVEVDRHERLPFWLQPGVNAGVVLCSGANSV